MISQGADKEALTDEGEKAENLVDPDDYKTMAVLLNTEESKEKDRRMSTVRGIKKEPAWFRRESIQRDSVVDMPKPSFRSDERKQGVRIDLKNSDRDTFSALRARKGSMWVVGEGSKVVEEEEDEDESTDTISDTHMEETEENVSAKLEQWKRRRVERLER